MENQNNLQNFLNKTDNSQIQTSQVAASSGSKSKIIIIGCVAVILVLICIIISAVAFFTLNKNDGNKDSSQENISEKDSEDEELDDLEQEEEEISNGECNEELLEQIMEDGIVSAEEINKINEDCAEEIADLDIPQLDEEELYKTAIASAKEVNQKFTFENIDFEVFEVKDYGQTLTQSVPCEGESDNDCIPKDCSSKNGRYIQVKLRITNNSTVNTNNVFYGLRDADLVETNEDLRPFCNYDRAKVPSSGATAVAKPGETIEAYFLFDVEPNKTDFYFMLYHFNFTLANFDEILENAEVKVDSVDLSTKL